MAIDVVFYQSQYTANLIDDRVVVMQGDKTTYTVIFNTNGLKGGQYKVEAKLRSYQTDLRSGSITVFIVQVIDRSGEIHITSPTTQTLGDALRIGGTIDKIGDQGVQMEVQGPSGIIFGPDWIETSRDMNAVDGKFSRKIPVSEPGNYDVSFSDQRGESGGFIGTVSFTVNAPATIPTPSQIPTTIRTTVPTTIPTVPTAVPTTKSPVPAWTVLVALAGAGIISALLRK
jgi:hypothetical protein